MMNWQKFIFDAVFHVKTARSAHPSDDDAGHDESEDSLDVPAQSPVLYEFTSSTFAAVADVAFVVAPDALFIAFVRVDFDWSTGSILQIC